MRDRSDSLVGSGAPHPISCLCAPPRGVNPEHPLKDGDAWELRPLFTRLNRHTVFIFSALTQDSIKRPKLSLLFIFTLGNIGKVDNNNWGRSLRARTYAGRTSK